MKRKSVLCFLILALLVAGGGTAKALTVYLDGEAFPDAGVALHNNTTYVSVRMLAERFDQGWNVYWSGRQAVVETEDFTLSATPDALYVTVDDQPLFVEHGVLLRSGVTMIPVRVAAEIFGATVDWDGATNTVTVSKTGNMMDVTEAWYDSDALYWLSRIIHAESQGEPMAGKIAVGNVILNRVEDTTFPNTIYTVIFDRNWGVQFEPTINGAIYNTPNSDSVVAAKLALSQANIVGNCLYFLNPTTAQNFWIMSNRTYFTTIGGHFFYL